MDTTRTTSSTETGAALSDPGREFWEEHYRARLGATAPSPNALLVGEATGLSPGTALDLGCGQGGDAIWLASRGWRVTAADLSATALKLAAGHAEAAGVADAIRWERHDLGASFPAGSFDLVSTCYLHSPDERVPRQEVLRKAAAAVAPGGTLVVIGHTGFAPSPEPGPGIRLPTGAEVLGGLALEPERWEMQRREDVTRDVVHAGQSTTRTDNVLRLRLLHGAS